MATYRQHPASLKQSRVLEAVYSQASSQCKACLVSKQEINDRYHTLLERQMDSRDCQPTIMMSLRRGGYGNESWSSLEI